MSDEPKPTATVDATKLVRENTRMRDQRQRVTAKVAALLGIDLSSVANPDLPAMLDQLGKAHGDLKARAESGPSEIQAKLDEANAQIKRRDHRDAWKDAIGKELADKVGVEDVWGKLNYQPGDAIPTAQQITEQLGKAREAAPYLFKPAGETPAADDPSLPITLAPTGAPVGGGRGEPDRSGAKFRVRSADLSNGPWMQQNQDAVAKASAEGRLEIV